MSLPCECLSVQFVEDSIVVLTLNFNQYEVAEFPGYAFTATDPDTDIVYTIMFNVSGTVESGSWELLNSEDGIVLSLADVPADECPFGIFTGLIRVNYAISSECVENIELPCECIRVNVYSADSEVYQFQLNQLGYYNGFYYWSYTIGIETYFIWFNIESSSWVVSDSLGSSDGFLAELDFDGCPFGEWTTYSPKIASIISFECTEEPNPPIDVIEETCSPYEICKYDNLLKRNRVSLSKDIASISKREVYGFNCGDAWQTIFTKSMIIDALSCLPYGVYTEDEERCLIGKLNDKCNC
jgi:hypothetical protein